MYAAVPSTVRWRPCVLVHEEHGYKDRGLIYQA